MTPSYLTLPDRAPELCQYGTYAWDEAVFAIYFLLPESSPHRYPSPTATMHIVLPTGSALERDNVLANVAHILNEKWLALFAPEVLVRPAPSSIVQVRSLREAVQRHGKLDKEVKPRVRGRDGSADGDLGWWPNGFVVVGPERVGLDERGGVETDGRGGGGGGKNGWEIVDGKGEVEEDGERGKAVVPWKLRFVYADEGKGGEVGMFEFRVEDAYMMLSSLRFGDERVGMCREAYAC